MNAADFVNNPEMTEVYMHPNGTVKGEGDLIKNPYLANTLELLSRYEYVFYHEDGKIGRELVKELTDENVSLHVYAFYIFLIF